MGVMDNCSDHAKWALSMSLYFAFAGVMIGIGANNLESATYVEGGCPSAKQLPSLLIGGAVVIFLGFGLRRALDIAIQQFCKENEDDGCCGTMAKCGLKVMYDSVFIAVAAAWAIYTAVYTRAQVNAFEEDKFICTSSVYNMTIVAIVMCLINCVTGFLFAVVGRACCNTLFACCKSVANDNNA